MNDKWWELDKDKDRHDLGLGEFFSSTFLKDE